MNYRTLGSSSLKLSEIGFGCMSLEEDEKLNKKLIDSAIERGVNFFDTADLYQKGANEITVGKAILEKRKHIILSTKVGNQWKADGSGWEWKPGKAYILSAINDSLRRLQTDYIDLYQLHGGTLDDPIDEIIEAFEILKEQGKIRNYGISSIRPAVIREYVKRSNIVSVMMQYSLLDRRPEEFCLSFLQEHKVGILARGSLAKGLLVNKDAAPYLNYTEMQVAQAAQAIKHNVTTNRNAAQTAIQFVLKYPVISSAVVGIRTMSQLEDILASAGVSALKETEFQELQSSIPKNYYTEHR